MKKLEAVKSSACLETDEFLTSPEITDWDEAVYRRLVSVALTPQERERALTPPRSYPRQEAVLALHWHPEHIPLDVVMRRVDALYQQLLGRAPDAAGRAFWARRLVAEDDLVLAGRLVGSDEYFRRAQTR